MLKKNLASLEAFTDTQIPSGAQHIAGGAIMHSRGGTITRDGETFSYNWDVIGTVTHQTIYNRDNLTYQQWLNTTEGQQFINDNE